MRCHEAQRQLDQMGKTDENMELVQHLNTCEDCRDYAQKRHLVSLLASLPVRQPAPGFEDRVLGNALRRRGTGRVQTRWAMATAASVLLAVFLTMQYMPGDDPGNAVDAVETAIVEARPLETRQVNLRLNSRRTMSDAIIRVQLDDHLELEGYTGVQNLEWRTTLKNGANQLSLPVRLLKNQSGTMTVMLEHKGASKRFSIKINPAPRDDDRGHSLTMA